MFIQVSLTIIILVCVCCVLNPRIRTRSLGTIALSLIALLAAMIGALLV
jgi:hypothetical protein